MLQDIPSEQTSAVPTVDYRLGDGIFASSLAAYFILGIFAPDPGARAITTDLLLGGTVMYCVLILFVYAFLTLRGRNVWTLFGLNQLDMRRTFLPAAMGIISIYPTILLLTWVSRLALGETDVTDETIAFLLSKPGAGALALAAFLVIVVAPVAEEFIFRGLLYGVAKKFGGRMPALIATSALFAAIHLNPVAIVPLFVLSVVLTLAYERTGSLWTPIAMHMFFNGVQFFIILLFPQWIQ